MCGNFLIVQYVGNLFRLKLLNLLGPRSNGSEYEKQITFVPVCMAYMYSQTCEKILTKGKPKTGLIDR